MRVGRKASGPKYWMQITERNNQAAIILDRAADEVCALDWLDDAGEVIDLSRLNVRFIVKSLPELTFTLALDPSDSRKRLLEFDQAFSAALGRKAREFCVEAIHEDGKVTILTRGTIATEGWVS